MDEEKIFVTVRIKFFNDDGGHIFFPNNIYIYRVFDAVCKEK